VTIENSLRIDMQTHRDDPVREGLAPGSMTDTREPDCTRAAGAQCSVTRRRFTAVDPSFDYTATAGTLVIRDDDDKPIADMGYIAYTRDDCKELAERPLLFAFNGGPGCSSVFVHMGLLGPKRVLVTDAAPTPPAPYRMVDNEFSILDEADLVFIDPVSTGLSRAVSGKKDSDFWSVDADVDCVSRFIEQYASDNHRWCSPKYLLGESYGTIRATSVAAYLSHRDSLSFNGLILIGAAMDIEAIHTELPGNERPYATYLPSFTAAAWYHDVLPGGKRPLEPLLEEARNYALGPFATALMRGNALSEEARHTVAQAVHGYTGLSIEYIKAANFRISEFAFANELLRGRRSVISRLDARFIGPISDPLQKAADYDPLRASITSAYAAAFQDYFRRDLGFGAGRTYRITNYHNIGDGWDWSHRPIGVAGLQQTLVNSGVDLAAMMTRDSNLKVLVLNGYFDLGSAFAATEYMISHLKIPGDSRSRITMKYYESGHLPYIHLPSLRRIKEDLAAFLESAH
jgi:carboxypeptidase C (cathepsin A)